MSAPNRFGANASKSLLVAVGNLQGENGTHTVRNTAEAIGQWTSIQCIADAVFTKLTCPNNTGGSLDNITMTRGQSLCLGLITNVQLASGGVVLANK